MVNYYAILDAFPQMSQQDLLESYSNIISCAGLVFGRHRVDEALVSHPQHLFTGTRYRVG